MPPFVEGAPRLLIIGTFPPAPVRWDYPFFFPNRQNRLWDTLARVVHDDAQYALPLQDAPDHAVSLRKGLLRALDAGMVNIIRRCRRKNGSALDNDLEVLALEDIVGGFLRPFPSIGAVVLTSAAGKNSCLSLLRRHLRQQGIPMRAAPSPARDRAARLADPLAFTFALDGRELRVYSLYSPSPTAMRSGIKEADLFHQYQILRRI